MTKNRKAALAVLSCLMMLGSVVLAGCGFGGGGAAPAAPKAPAADKAPAAKPAPQAAKAPAAKPAASGPKQLVTNSNFAKWQSDGRPAGWRGSPSVAAKAAGQKSGAFALQLKPSTGDSSLSSPVRGNFAGKTLTLSIVAKAADENALGYVVDYKTAKGPGTAFFYFGKSDTWKKETRSVEIPKDALPDSLAVRLVLRNSKKPAQVDSVTLTAP
ncbi:MAG: hypothetical protein GX580_13355 [Candidatus Hydrogenedens sp.]|nr:hypothetical protein [Candidatus Hydrogenedens sp.]